MVHHGDQVQPNSLHNTGRAYLMSHDHLHAGEDEVTGQVLSTTHLAWQGHVQEQGPFPDILHTLISSKIQPRIERGSGTMNSQEYHTILQLLKISLNINSQGSNHIQIDNIRRG